MSWFRGNDKPLPQGFISSEDKSAKGRGGRAERVIGGRRTGAAAASAARKIDSSPHSTTDRGAQGKHAHEDGK